MGNSSSNDRRGSSSSNRNQHGGNRNRSRHGGGTGNRSRGGRPKNAGMRKNGDNKNPVRQVAEKEGIGAKVLRFLGFGKKDKTAKSASESRPDRRQSNRKPRRKPVITEPTNARLYVGNLSYSVKDGDLTGLFAEVGTVVTAEVITNPHNGKSKGFGFVEMSSIDEAREAVKSLQNRDFQGREILVSGAKDKPASREGGTSSRRRSGGDGRSRRDSSSSARSSRGGDRSRGNNSRSGGERRGRKRYEDDPPSDRKPRKVEVISGTVLQVGNLADEVSEDDLHEVFRGICEPTALQINSAEDSGKKESARVEFSSVEDAQKAVTVLDGKSFMGQELRLSGKAESKAGV